MTETQTTTTEQAQEAQTQPEAAQATTQAPAQTMGAHPGGMAIAPDVLDTIVALALKDVEGVAHMGTATQKLFPLFAKLGNLGVSVSMIDENTIDVSVVLTVLEGRPLDKIAADVRNAIADAILSQTGLKVNRIDIHVDGILFQD